MPRQPKILIVDDSPQLRELYQMLLRKLDCQPVVADSGDQAIKFIEHAAVPFDLVILDLMMPGLSGWETLQQIRGLAGGGKVPIVVITGIELPADQIARLRQSCQQVLMKSAFSIGAVKDALAELIPGYRQN